MKEISRDEYTREVTEQSKECWVVVYLWSDNRESKAMDIHVREIANKFRAVKFVRIRGSLCITNFPDKYVTPYIYIHIQYCTSY